MALVTEAATRLWTPEGAPSLAYLHRRGLDDETIQSARLGVVESVSIPTREGDRCYRARGVVIPWFDRDRLVLVKIRQPEGTKPKYIEAYRDRPRIFPGPDVIEPGCPLVICEGELDALLLAQELRDLAAVVTLGSASGRPDPDTLLELMPAAPWFLALDGDQAGDKAASGWPARSIRVRPPEGKDWTEAAQAGVDLRGWWLPRLGGTEPRCDFKGDASGTAELVEAGPPGGSGATPPPEADLAPRSPYWVAPDLMADELDALDEIVAVPSGAPWPALGELIEEGRRHNAAVRAEKGRR
jgi:hypothetical protein